ncbi:hypothetical protein GSI_03009 [Ganoderma sinense ZZ0214-1]|uniref:Uncharacterized protein n=1 Tax=Ganoderma sinense ZZ0214-1 TaxID=1077348 RepID=A0A2G8SN96_9APHY|nr:hypothetical protein GSI_03009 [Ganoderma sinense ZZ0214-1]
MLVIVAIITVVFLILLLSSNIALVFLFREMSKLGRLELVPPILRRVVIHNDEDDDEDDIVDNDDNRTPRVPPPTPLLEVVDLPFEFMHAHKPLPYRMIDIYYFYDMAEHWTATYWSMYDVLNDSQDDYALLTPLTDGLDLDTVVPTSYDLDE